MLLTDIEIKKLVESDQMIKPFAEHTSVEVSECLSRRRRVLSYGSTSVGYDIRLSDKEFKVFRKIPGAVMDPKHFDDRFLEPVQLFDSADGRYFILPAHSYGLGVAVERLSIPANVSTFCMGKSTYARCGIIVNVTPAEPGWEGHLTLEFSNSSACDCKIYANEGVAQLWFFKTPERCGVSYSDRAGKYQHQPEKVVNPRML